MEAGGHHIAEHDGRSGLNAFGETGEIRIRLVHVEKFREYAVLEVRELPARQHAARVHGISPLRFEAAPIGGNGGNDDLFSDFKVLDQRTDLYDFPDRLMTENHIPAIADSALPDRVHVGRAGRNRDGLNDRVQRTASGDFFFYPPRLADSEHCITFHFHNRFSSFQELSYPHYNISGRNLQGRFLKFLRFFAVFSYKSNPRTMLL